MRKPLVCSATAGAGIAVRAVLGQQRGNVHAQREVADLAESLKPEGTPRVDQDRAGRALERIRLREHASLPTSASVLTPGLTAGAAFPLHLAIHFSAMDMGELSAVFGMTNIWAVL